MKDFGALDFFDSLKAEGRIKHSGFSFHDDYEAFKAIADAYRFDVCQLQLNILDTHKQATLEGMRYAAARGISVVIMEPLRGGLLANVPEDVRRIYEKYPVRRSPVDWAFRYMLNFPESMTVLSGMGDMEQVKENIAVCSDAEANGMVDAELRIVDEVKACYEGRARVPCTECDYCLPCPNSVDISGIFEIYNEAAMFDTWKRQRSAYKNDFGEKNAALCVECGECEGRCPQKIQIPKRLKDAHSELMAQS
jgi:predicted aldo/keto reductase-like oxidoreductase